MKCIKCGTEFEEGIFCPKCGTKHETLEKESRKTTPPSEFKTNPIKRKPLGLLIGLLATLIIVLIIVFAIINPFQKSATNNTNEISATNNDSKDNAFHKTDSFNDNNISSEYNDTYYSETDPSESQDNIYEDEPQQTDNALNTLQVEENQSKTPPTIETEDRPTPSLPFDINGTYHLEKLSRLYTAEVSGVPDNPYIHVTGKEQDGTIIIDYSGPLEILFSAVDNEKIPSKTIQETEEGSRKLNCYFYNNRLSISDSKHNNNDQVHSFNGYYDK